MSGRITVLILFFLSLGLGAQAVEFPAAHRDLEFTAAFRRTNGLTAGDGGISIPLSDGTVLWLFGDSHINDFESASGTIPCLFQVRNAAMLQHTNTGVWETLTAQNPRGSLIRGAPDEKIWYWPEAGFQSGDTVYICCSKLRRNGVSGSFDFKQVYQCWAKIKRSDLVRRGTNSIPVTFSRLQDFKGIEFKCGFSPEADGYTYAFGVKMVKTNCNIYVARFLSIRPEGHWTYWDGTRWTAAVYRARPIGHAATPSMSVAKLGTHWVAVSSAFSVHADMGRDIFINSTTNITGPFSALRKIYEIDDTEQGHYPFFYLPTIHPEFINAAGEVLVTYSINGYEPALPNCVKNRMNPDYYRLRAIRVPWSQLEK